LSNPVKSTDPSGQAVGIIPSPLPWPGIGLGIGFTNVKLIPVFVSLTNRPTRCLGRNGGVSGGPILRVNLVLGAMPLCDGFVVQEVKLRCDRKNCPCRLPGGNATHGEDFHYYEAVFVPRLTPIGTVVMRDRIASGTGWAPRLNSCGVYRQAASARFYCMGTTGDLRTLWTPGTVTYGRTSGCPTRGRPFSTANRPRWWIRQQTQSTPTAARYLGIRWRCCCGQREYVGVTHSP